MRCNCKPGYAQVEVMTAINLHKFAHTSSRLPGCLYRNFRNEAVVKYPDGYFNKGFIFYDTGWYAGSMED